MVWRRGARVQKAGPDGPAWVQGDVGIGHGWWLKLPERFTSANSDSGELVLQNERLVVFVNLIEPPEEATHESIRAAARVSSGKTAAKSVDTVTDLGETRGRGWTGSWSREELTDPAGAAQFLAAMAAPGTFLMLTVRFFDVAAVDDAMWLISNAYHDTVSAGDMDKLITAGP